MPRRDEILTKGNYIGGLPKALWANTSVTLGEKAVLVVLIDHLGPENEKSWPMPATIAHEVGMSHKGVRNALKGLVAKGLIRCVGNRKRKGGKAGKGKPEWEITIDPNGNSLQLSNGVAPLSSAFDNTPVHLTDSKMGLSPISHVENRTESHQHGTESHGKGLGHSLPNHRMEPPTDVNLTTGGKNRMVRGGPAAASPSPSFAGSEYCVQIEVKQGHLPSPHDIQGTPASPKDVLPQSFVPTVLAPMGKSEGAKPQASTLEVVGPTGDRTLDPEDHAVDFEGPEHAPMQSQDDEPISFGPDDEYDPYAPGESTAASNTVAGGAAR